LKTTKYINKIWRWST